MDNTWLSNQGGEAWAWHIILVLLVRFIIKPFLLRPVAFWPSPSFLQRSKKKRRNSPTHPKYSWVMSWLHQGRSRLVEILCTTLVNAWKAIRPTIIFSKANFVLAQGYACDRCSSICCIFGGSLVMSCKPKDSLEKHPNQKSCPFSYKVSSFSCVPELLVIKGTSSFVVFHSIYQH